MFFANEQRENVRDENPGISFGSSTCRPIYRFLWEQEANDIHLQVKSAKSSARDGRP